MPCCGTSKRVPSGVRKRLNTLLSELSITLCPGIVYAGIWRESCGWITQKWFQEPKTSHITLGVIQNLVQTSAQSFAGVCKAGNVTTIHVQGPKCAVFLFAIDTETAFVLSRAGDHIDPISGEPRFVALLRDVQQTLK